MQVMKYFVNVVNSAVKKSIASIVNISTVGVVNNNICVSVISAVSIDRLSTVSVVSIVSIINNNLLLW